MGDGEKVRKRLSEGVMDEALVRPLVRVTRQLAHSITLLKRRVRLLKQSVSLLTRSIR